SNLTTSDGNAEATEQSLREYCIQSERDLADVNRLIRILPQSPMDTRTWFGTPRTTNILHASPGKYCHLGLEIVLMRQIQNLRVASEQEVTIQLDVDGMDPFTSFSTQIWKVLCRLVKRMQSTPFFIGVSSGTRLPENVNDYLQPMETEIRSLLRHGVKMAGAKDRKPLELAVVVCDHPARAFVKRKKIHSGYRSCDKCTQQGVHFKHMVKRSIKGRTNVCSRLHRRFSEAPFSGTAEQPTSGSGVEFQWKADLFSPAVNIPSPKTDVSSPCISTKRCSVEHRMENGSVCLIKRLTRSIDWHTLLRPGILCYCGSSKS
ncbi:hypothetical protein FGIG_00816, partial [Fasciola gigantica]